MSEDEQNEKRFDVSVQTRNLEIELFWKRSLFFWGFISAAFIGYAALRQSDLRILLACFGMVCSCAWTLVNRGSKYCRRLGKRKLGVMNSLLQVCCSRRRRRSLTKGVGFVAENIRSASSRLR